MKYHTYLHFDKKRRFFERGILLFFLFFAFYGFYKNGLVYVGMGKLSLFQALRYLMYPLIGSLFSVVIASLKEKKIFFSVKDISLGVLLGLLVPPEFPILLYTVVVFAFLLLLFWQKKRNFHLSIVAGYKCVLMLLTHVLSFNLYNQVEMSTPFLYGTIDTFFGKAVGSLGTTNIFLLCLLYFYLTTNFYYKKELPIYIIAAYMLSFCFYFFVTDTPLSMTLLLNNSVFFGAIVLFINNAISPISGKLEIGYGIGIGVVTFLFTLLGVDEAIYIVIFLASILYSIWFHCDSKGIFYANKCKKV